MLSALDPHVLLLDGHGGILRWSQSFCERSCCPLSRGDRDWAGFFQESDVKTIADILADGRTKGETTEQSWSTPGEHFDTSWSSLTIADPDGLVEFVVLTGAQDDGDTAPASGRTRHSRLLPNSPFEMWAFDRGTYRFLAVNDATAHEYGYTQGELRSMRVLDVWAWDDVRRLVEMVTELGSGQTTKGRWRHRRKGGGRFDVVADVVVTESSGRPVCVVLSRLDAETAPATLEGSDDGRPPAELRSARSRSQAAVVRALADHMEHVARPTGADGRGEQLIEEMARLGGDPLKTVDA